MPENLVNKNVDHILDNTEDGKAKQIAYSGLIIRIVKKHKDPMQTTFEIVYDSAYNDNGDSDAMMENLMKKIPMSMLYCKIITKEI